MELRRAALKDAHTIWQLQLEAFADLLDKYQDYDTSPGNETIDRVEEKLKQPYTYFYYIVDENKIVGAVRIVDLKDGSRKRVSPIFVMKEYRNKGYAQSAMIEAEHIHGRQNWKLDTILQETGNCYLYEKLGYRKTGKIKTISDKMTIVYFEKD